MENNYNSGENMNGSVKTSSTDSKENSKTTGDSQVQDGEGVVRTEQPEKSYEKKDEQQEYIEQANNNTVASNESPVQNDKGLTL